MVSFYRRVPVPVTLTNGTLVQSQFAACKILANWPVIFLLNRSLTEGNVVPLHCISRYITFPYLATGGTGNFGISVTTSVSTAFPYSPSSTIYCWNGLRSPFVEGFCHSVWNRARDTWQLLLRCMGLLLLGPSLSRHVQTVVSDERDHWFVHYTNHVTYSVIHRFGSPPCLQSHTFRNFNKWPGIHSTLCLINLPRTILASTNK